MIQNKAGDHVLWRSKRIDKQNWDEDSALHVAVQYGHPHLVKQLLRYNCNPDLKNRAGT